jgi:hypothetical protein
VVQDQNATPPDPQVLLRTKDVHVSRAQKTLSAPPFLALALDLSHLPDTQVAIKALVRAGFSPQRLLQKFPNVTAWAMCASLLENYGNGSQEIWPLIGRLFGKEPSLPERTGIVDAFKSACRKIGLVTDGFDRNVDVFLIHVGVAKGQLGHVAKAFLQQEAANGLPSSDDVVQLNRWEDDAVLTYLPVGVQVPERPILHDETAWMAALFLKWRIDPSVMKQQSAFSNEFANAIEQVQKEIGSSALLATQPAPRLVWQDGRPQIQLPPGAGRLMVRIGDQILKLQRGQTWPLPQPLPLQLSWIVDGESRHLSLYDTPFILFNPEDGRQLVPRKGMNEWLVLASVAIVTSSEEFRIDGVEADLFGPKLYAATINLRGKPAVLSAAKQTITLRGSQRTRIGVEGTPIASQIGRGGSLWSNKADVVVQAALYSDQQIMLKAECDGASGMVECKLDEEDVGRIKLEYILSSLQKESLSNPTRLILTMMRREDGQDIETRIKREIFVWPSYTGQDGVVLACDVPPTNYVAKASKYISRDDTNNLCLDRKGGFDKALVAFEIDAEVRQFLVDWPETSIVLERSSGSREHLAIGSAIILSANDWNASLVVRSPNRQAALIIAGRQLDRPFVNTGSWVIPLRQLYMKHDNHIYLQSGSSQTLLARIETVAAPKNISVNHRGDGVTLQISVTFSIGGALISTEDENGTFEVSEFSYDHLPIDTPAALNVAVKKTSDNTVTIILKNSQNLEGMGLSDVSLRQTGNRNWTRLSKNRGDRIAVAVRAYDQTVVTVASMARLDRWLSECFAAECWDGGLDKILVGRWADTVRRIDEQLGGRAAILKLSHAEEAVTDWLPMKHILEIVPDLHSAGAIDFAALGAIDSPVGKSLAVISSLSSGKFRQNAAIDPTAFLGFKNARSADRLGEELSGFSAIRLITVLQVLGAARAFWDGRIVLGLEHRYAAMTSLTERCEDYRLFSDDIAEGPMSLRSARLNQLMQAVIKSGQSIPRGPEHGDQSYLLWIDQTLMAYATAARRNKVPELVKSAADQTGFTLGETRMIFGELLRLGPDLLSFHLICQELERLRP